MRSRIKWVKIFAMLSLSLGPAACEGCSNAAIFVGDAEAIEVDIFEQVDEGEDLQETGEIFPEEPTTDTPVEISETDEIEYEAMGCDMSAFDETAWSKVFATNNNAEPWQEHLIRETFDCNYITAGDSDELPGGGNDAWVLKLDRSGNVMWERTYSIGGSGPDIRSLALARDLGYVIGGAWGSSPSTSWMMKLDEGGNVLWHKIYRHVRQGGDIAVIEEDQGGGFVACGSITEGEWIETHTIGYYIIRIDDDGQVLWSKQFGDSSPTYSCSSIEQIPGGDLIVAGSVYSSGDDENDVFAQRLRADGTVVWQKRFLRETLDLPIGLLLAPDGGYVLAAQSYSPAEDEGDAWFLKLDTYGGVVLQEAIGGEVDDCPLSMASVGNDGYILCGRTLSFGAGGDDSWLLRVDSEGRIFWQKSYGGEQDDICLDIQSTTDGGFIVSGTTDSFGSNNLWIMRIDANGIISDSCPSGIGADTTAVVQETFAEAEDISIPVFDWDVIVDDLEIVPAYSFSAIETQCER
jgi:hypothetical protein